ncbi:MAG: GGDEF domain-containing protein [Vicinamibacterales bacterium]
MEARTPAEGADLQAQFIASRAASLALLNGSVFHFGLSASLILSFSLWDWYVDPAAWSTALGFRVAAAAVIVSTGLLQRATGTVRWAPVIAKVRFWAAVLAVAAVNAVVREGYTIGLAGLVAAFLGGPYIVLDRRDYLVTTLVPLTGAGLGMMAAGADRFTVTNATVFLALTIVVGLMLARVFEATNRRAFVAEQALMREARTDALTGLPNRRATEEFAVRELARQSRTGRPTAFVLCDVDHFKRVNDERGHDSGDRTIRAVGELLATVVRTTDRVGRWGGEEFLIVLPETTIADAVVLAERMRSRVEGAALASGPEGSITLSAGVAAMASFTGEPDARLAVALKAADAALYRAKAEGRNRVVVAGDAGPAASEPTG